VVALAASHACAALQCTPGVQSLSLEHALAHASLTHLKGEQSISATSQVWPPLQARAASTPLTQLPAPHRRPLGDSVRQAPLPSHWPSASQVSAGASAQKSCGSVPAGTGAHWPSLRPVTAALQALQPPQSTAAVSQHKPSTQRSPLAPLALPAHTRQCPSLQVVPASVLQALPRAFWLWQVPSAAQYFCAGQSASVAQPTQLPLCPLQVSPFEQVL
jgi:hypothetical protein